jgi:hypothetical protein
MLIAIGEEPRNDEAASALLQAFPDQGSTRSGGCDVRHSLWSIASSSGRAWEFDAPVAQALTDLGL